MKVTTIVAALPFAAAVDIGHADVKRATPQAPDGYAPGAVDCPSERPFVRTGSDLSPQEKEWLPRRRNQTIGSIKDFLKRNPIDGFDSDKYLSGVTANSTSLPNIGIAVSGGGYRAMLNGAGAIAAFDGRSPGSTGKGNLGGLLQSATYLSGLSGGGWLVGSIYTNNFTTVHDAVNSGKIWQLEQSILEGPKGMDSDDYYKAVIKQVQAKHDAGYNTSVTDYWGRMLAFQLVNPKDGGPAYTFSSIADDPYFSSAQAPLPFLVADSRAPGEKNTTVNSTLFEFNPWELGSTDPELSGFVPLKYVGSNFTNGKLASDAKCVRGFDSVSYVMGTSSSLFNQILLHYESDPGKYAPKGVPKFVVKLLLDVLQTLSKTDNDIADYYPNPFRGWNAKSNNAASTDHLTLVDGGEDGENVPYHPHLVRERNVDVVFSVDSSADTSNWPDGSAPMKTYERSLSSVSNGTSFPAVPGINTFINLKLNTLPTFFGCNSSNTTEPAPLIVYLPNYPYMFQSNTSTYDMSYNNSVRDAMITNGWAVVTQLNGTRNTDWPTCVSCAMMHRSFERTKTQIPAACTKCFDKYCWNGTIDERSPQTYAPALFDSSKAINTTKSGADSAGSRSLPGWTWAMGIAMALAFVIDF